MAIPRQKLTIFHVGGGDDDIGPTRKLLEIEELDIDLYVFEIIEDEGYTTVEASQTHANVTTRIVPVGIGENDFQKVEFRVNKHPLSSSVLPGSDLTGPNNPNYSGIHDWAENTALDYTFSATLRTIDSLVQSGEVPLPDFISLDIQGLELAALKGATSALGESVLGVVTESEFEEIYVGQGLFSEQLNFLRSKGFRFVDFETRQDWFFGPPVGKGFFTVAESSFLLHVYSDGGEALDKGFATGVPISSVGKEKLFKLALTAFALSRYSYFYFIMEYLATNESKYFAQLSSGVYAKYTRVFLSLQEAWAGGGDKEYFVENFHNIFEIPMENQPRNSRLKRRYYALKLFVYRAIPAALRARLR